MLCNYNPDGSLHATTTFQMKTDSFISFLFGLFVAFVFVAFVEIPRTNCNNNDALIKSTRILISADDIFKTDAHEIINTSMIRRPSAFDEFLAVREEKNKMSVVKKKKARQKTRSSNAT